MPAIRYRKNGTFCTVSHAGRSRSDLVSVLLKNGDSDLVEWLGFICIPATKQIIGRPAKIVGGQVSRDDGGLNSVWHPVNKDEFVLGWMIEQYRNDRIVPGVFGIVNTNGWPVIMQNDSPPKPHRLDAKVTAIPTRRASR